MKKTLITIFALLLGFFIFDRVLEKGLWWLHEHSKFSDDKPYLYVANDVNSDFILMGASRTSHHVVPSIIEDSLQTTVYVAGFDGSPDIFFQYANLNLILKHHIPKIVCLEMGNLVDGTSVNLPMLAPYIGQSEQIDSVFKDTGTYIDYQLSHVYRYNSCVLSNFTGIIKNDAKGADIQGYRPLPSIKMGEIMQSKDYKVDSVAVRYLHKFINTCKQQNIQLIFCASPWYVKPTPTQYDSLKLIAKVNHIPFLDYHTNGLFQERKDNWKDANHLSAKGAELFSPIFAHDVKALLISSGQMPE